MCIYEMLLPVSQKQHLQDMHKELGVLYSVPTVVHLQAEVGMVQYFCGIPRFSNNAFSCGTELHVELIASKS